MKKTGEKPYIPLFAKIAGIMTGIAVIVHFTYYISSSFAEFFNLYISQIFRRICAYITNIIPFSLAELLIYLILPAIVAVAVHAIRFRKSKRNEIRLFSCVLAIFMLIYSLFVLNYAGGYRGKYLYERIGLDNKDVSADELYATASWLNEKITELVPSVEFGEKSFSKMPYSFSELNDKMLEAYDNLPEEYDFINNYYTKGKKVMSDEIMTYMHLLGVYTYFTGEINVNTNYPDYRVPEALAHEMAHQRGIAREDEANFISFMVCINSDDAYIRYSGYVSVYLYVINALASADYDLYSRACSEYPIELYYEFIAENEYMEKYRDTTIGEISSSVNDAYLKSQGTQGRVSYGLVTNLTVSYYLKNVAE